MRTINHYNVTATDGTQYHYTNYLRAQRRAKALGVKEIVTWQTKGTGARSSTTHNRRTITV